MNLIRAKEYLRHTDHDIMKCDDMTNKEVNALIRKAFRQAMIVNHCDMTELHPDMVVEAVDALFPYVPKKEVEQAGAKKVIRQFLRKYVRKIIRN